MSFVCPGDVALGYDLSSLQAVGLDYEAYVNKGGRVPDVILVRKSYEEKRQRRRAKGLPERVWKLRQLEMEVEGGEGAEGGKRGGRAAQAAAQAQGTAADRQRFMEVRA